jgi:hypothetical protein
MSPLLWRARGAITPLELHSNGPLVAYGSVGAGGAGEGSALAGLNANVTRHAANC